jgi:hypothetical protein
MKDKNQQKDKHPERNSNSQGVDKAPGEEKGKNEKLKMTDLKGKKVDGDPELESDQPVKQKSDNEE